MSDFIGPYRRLRPLGRGGNAEVLLVERDGREYALKLLASRDPRSEPYRRFLDEIRILRAEAGNEGVLPLIDAHVPPNGRERPWLVTPAAQPVRTTLQEASPDEVVAAVASFAGTLTDLATRRVHHRDLKPENLFRLGTRWVIGDFGLVTFPEKTALTTQSRKLGPLYYIAPEMLLHPASADPAPADVYSLAKVLWVLLTGQTYPTQVVDLLVRETCIAYYCTDKRVASLDALVAHATSADPLARPSISEFARQLMSWPPRANRQESSTDLSWLRERIDGLTARARERDRVVAERVAHVERVYADIGPRLAELQQRLDDSFAGNSLPRPNSDLFARFGIGIPDARWSRALEYRRQAHGADAEVVVAAGVQAGDGDLLHIAALLAITSPRLIEVVWTRWFDELPGAPAEVVAIEELLTGLHAQFEPALARYLDVLESDVDAAPAAAAPPTLSLFQISPALVRVRDRPTFVELQVGFAAPAGIAEVQVPPCQGSFKEPGGGTVTFHWMPRQHLFSGSNYRGMMRTFIKVQPEHSSGRWLLDSLRLHDALNRVEMIDAGSLPALGFPTYFDVEHDRPSAATRAE